MAECPREPGYYWAHKKQWDDTWEWIICEVFQPNTKLYPDLWHVGIPADCDQYSLERFEEEVDRFVGPLQPPEEG